MAEVLSLAIATIEEAYDAAGTVDGGLAAARNRLLAVDDPRDLRRVAGALAVLALRDREDTAGWVAQLRRAAEARAEVEALEEATDPAAPS